MRKDSSVGGGRKYIVDTVGELPVILMEIDDTDPQNHAITDTYIYAGSQTLARYNGGQSQPKEFYLHDRLGSVRQVIGSDGAVKLFYIYTPFGSLYDSAAAPQVQDNPLMFTGQWYDQEIGQYFLRARQYDPQIYRFTARDPVRANMKGQ